MTDDRADIRQAVVDTANGLFAERVTQKMLEEAEAAGFPRDFWEEVVSLGLTAAALPEEAGGLGSLRDAGALLRPLGFHGVPLPLAECLLAGWLLSTAGLAMPEGVLTFVPQSIGLSAKGADLAATGLLKNVPWGRYADAVLAIAEEEGEARLVLLPASKSVEAGQNLAGEPRDQLRFDAVSILASAPLPLPVARIRAMAAGLRAAMMAGALERILELTVTYAKDRVQFGKPIGKFQAIQQQIAILANHTAASVMAVERAIALVEDEDGGKLAAIAKVRVGEGSNDGVRIAHQVHGAMGFTHEHILHHFTRRLWAWRDEQGSEAHWAYRLGEDAIAGGADALWTFVGETI